MCNEAIRPSIICECAGKTEVQSLYGGGTMGGSESRWAGVAIARFSFKEIEKAGNTENTDLLLFACQEL